MRKIVVATVVAVVLSFAAVQTASADLPGCNWFWDLCDWNW